MRAVQGARGRVHPVLGEDVQDCLPRDVRFQEGARDEAADSRWIESECRHGGISEMSSSVQSPLKMVRSVISRTTATEML